MIVSFYLLFSQFEYDNSKILEQTESGNLLLQFLKMNTLTDQFIKIAFVFMSGWYITVFKLFYIKKKKTIKCIKLIQQNNSCFNTKRENVLKSYCL